MPDFQAIIVGVKKHADTSHKGCGRETHTFRAGPVVKGVGEIVLYKTMLKQLPT